MINSSIADHHRYKAYSLYFVCVLLIISASGCGDQTSDQAKTAPSDTGAASFSIQWHSTDINRNTVGSQVHYAIEDCSALGIESITCDVYNESNTPIAHGGPWPCDAHGGRIESIPAGSGRTFTVLGWNGAGADGDVIYQGQTSGITIAPGEIADTGAIDAYPFFPSGLEAYGISDKRIDLAWTISTDIRAVIAGYNIYRAGVLHDTAASMTYSDTTSLSPTTEYCYTVSAFDLYGNESGQTNEVCASTTDNGAPSVHIEAPADGTIIDQHDPIAFSGSGEDPEDGPLSGYSLVWTSSIDDEIGTGESFSSLLTEGRHTITLAATDSRGSTSIDTIQILADYTPPSVPENIRADSIFADQINIAWNASSDNIELKGYRIYRDDVLIGSSSSENYNDTGLTQNTQYCYSVKTYDGAGHESAMSKPALCLTTLTSYTWYRDADGDNYGDPDSDPIESVTQPAGYVTDNSDCLDTNPSVNPGQNEVCFDGIDNNCDQELDENCNGIGINIDSDFDYIAEGFPMGLSVGETYAAIDLADDPVEVLKEPEYGRFHFQHYSYLKMGNSQDNVFSFVLNTNYEDFFEFYFDSNNNEDLTDDQGPITNQGKGVPIAATVSLTVDIVTDSGMIQRPYRLWMWLDGNYKVRFYSLCHYTGQLYIGSETFTVVAFERTNHDALYKDSGLYIDLNHDGVLDQNTENFMDQTTININNRDYEIQLNYP